MSFLENDILLLLACTALSFFGAYFAARFIKKTMLRLIPRALDWLHRRRISQGVFKRIGGNGSRLGWELRRIESALELSEKYKILGLRDSVKEDPRAHEHECSVCGKEAKYFSHCRPASSPFEYLCAYFFDNVRYGRPILRTRKKRKEEPVSLNSFSGMQMLLRFCSPTCEASYLLWNFYLPSNKSEHLIRWILISKTIFANIHRIIKFPFVLIILLLKRRKNKTRASNP